MIGSVVFSGSVVAQALLKADLKNKNKKELLDLLLDAYTNSNIDIKNCRTKLQNLAERIGRVELDYWGAESVDMMHLLVSLLVMYQDYLFSIMDKSSLYRKCINAISHNDMNSLDENINRIKMFVSDERMIENKIQRQEKLLSEEEEKIMRLYD